MHANCVMRSKAVSVAANHRRGARDVEPAIKKSKNGFADLAVVGCSYDWIAVRRLFPTV